MDSVKIYLDTIAWNQLYDLTSGGSLKHLEGPEYFFSSCNLDEFCLSESDRAKNLAKFAWDLSNKKKLLDHVEFTIAELRGYPDNNSLSPFDNDQAFMNAWAHIREFGVPDAVHALHEQQSKKVKREFRQFLRSTRVVFRPVFEQFKAVGIEEHWTSVLQAMSDEGHIGQFLTDLIRQEGLIHLLPKPASVIDTPYAKLPATASWVEYYVALSFLAGQESDKHAKPDYGDQVDFRHACYAGIVDLFVTADSRMAHVLANMVVHKRAEVVDPAGLLKRIT